MNTQLAQANAPKPSALRTMAGRLNVDADSLLSTLKGTVCKGCSDAEMMTFAIVANEYQLNPFTKQLYAFPAKGGGIVPVVSVDGWISMANNHPQMDGIEFEDVHDQSGNLVSIACSIFRKDRSRPIRVMEYLDECKRPTDPWKMPHRMLRHKALIQCSRVAFGFSGLHDEDEADDIARNGGMRQATGHVVDQAPPKVVTGGNPSSAAEAPKATRKAKAEPVEPIETAPQEEAPAIPARATMIADLRTAYRAAGIKTGPEAEEIARKAGYLPDGQGISQLSEADMFRIYQNRDSIFVASPDAPPTEGGQEA